MPSVLEAGCGHSSFVSPDESRVAFEGLHLHDVAGVADRDVSLRLLKRRHARRRDQ